MKIGFGEIGVDAERVIGIAHAHERAFAGEFGRGGIGAEDFVGFGADDFERAVALHIFCQERIHDLIIGKKHIRIAFRFENAGRAERNAIDERYIVACAAADSNASAGINRSDKSVFGCFSHEQRGIDRAAALRCETRFADVNAVAREKNVAARKYENCIRERIVHRNDCGEVVLRGHERIIVVCGERGAENGDPVQRIHVFGLTEDTAEGFKLVADVLQLRIQKVFALVHFLPAEAGIHGKKQRKHQHCHQQRLQQVEHEISAEGAVAIES